MSRAVVRKLEIKYEAVRTLYEGGSDVHLCRNEITGLHEVVKSFDALGKEESVAVREATLLQKIRHDHLVPVLSVGRNIEEFPPPANVIEIVMPYYELGSVLDAFDREDRFSMVEAMRLIRAALLGIGELHEKHHILHRDIKTSNLFLTNDPLLLRVGDLGLAAPMEDDGTAEAAPTAHLWTPPETYVTNRVDRRSDLYGLGLTLHELTSRPFPYDNYSRSEIADRLEKGRRGLRPADLSFAAPVPSRLRTVIRKAIDVKPNNRYALAADMAAALNRVDLIDWRMLEESPDQVVWAGRLARRRGRTYRVIATWMPRKGVWRMSGHQQVSTWTRVRDDQEVSGLEGSEAALFFESILRLALSR